MAFFIKNNQDQNAILTNGGYVTLGNTLSIENGVINSTATVDVPIDDEVSTTSENPVQNKVITEYINSKESGIDAALEEKANISDLSIVATSGSYNDLEDKPEIPEAQVQANWVETDSSEPSYIQNKPSLATVATTGDYEDLSNTPLLATVATTGDYNDLTNIPIDGIVPQRYLEYITGYKETGVYRVENSPAIIITHKHSTEHYDQYWNEICIEPTQIRTRTIRGTNIADAWQPFEKTSLHLSSSYTTGVPLELSPGDSYETAFANLERLIEETQLVASSGFNDLNKKIEEGIEGAEDNISDLEDSISELETSINEVNTNLSEVIEQDELVTAAAFNDLNERLTDFESEVSELSTRTEDLETSVSEASGNISNISSSLEETIQSVENMELVISASLNDLNSRKADSDSLANVAFSGSYNDLTDVPTINSIGEANNYQIEVDSTGIFITDGNGVKYSLNIAQMISDGLLTTV